MLNIAWVLFGTFKNADYRAAALGMFIGLIIFAPFINFQQTYAYSHPEEFKKVLGVSSEDFQNKYNIKKNK